MKYVIIGKIVNTHGLKGEVRILSDFPYKDKVFKENMNYYIGENKEKHKSIRYRHHKIFEMLTFEDIDDIDKALLYKGKYIFVNKEDVQLDKNQYLDEDIINLKVYISSKEVGKVKKIVRYNKNNLLLVTNKEKDFYIPYNFDIIKKVCLEEGYLQVDNIGGLVE